MGIRNGIHMKRFQSELPGQFDVFIIYDGHSVAVYAAEGKSCKLSGRRHKYK